MVLLLSCDFSNIESSTIPLSLRVALFSYLILLSLSLHEKYSPKCASLPHTHAQFSAMLVGLTFFGLTFILFFAMRFGDLNST